jgi:hypothetical protein
MTSGYAPHPAKIQRLLRDVFAGSETLADEAVAGDLMSAVVDARIAGRCLLQLERRLETHLYRCPEWAEVLDVLEFVARLEADGAMPTIEDLLASLRAHCREARQSELARRRPGPRGPADLSTAGENDADPDGGRRAGDSAAD